MKKLFLFFTFLFSLNVFGFSQPSDLFRLYKAVLEDDFDGAETLLKKGLNPNEHLTGDERVQAAERYAEKAGFKSGDAEFNYAVENFDETPILISVNKGNEEISLEFVKLLCAYKADLSVFSGFSDHHSPLSLAVANGYLNVLRCLLENGADANICRSYDWTPLMWAAYYDDVECAEILLEHGADVFYKNEIGETALILAGIFFHSEVSNLLQKTAGLFYDCTEDDVEKFEQAELFERNRKIDEAIKIYKTFAEKNDSLSSKCLAWIYKNKDSEYFNPELAWKYVQLPASLGDAGALICKANFLIEGFGTEKNESMAFDIFNTLSKADNSKPFAFFRIAQCFENGIAVDKDLDAAVYFYKKAADLKCPQANYRLGKAYQTGDLPGTTHDEQKAISYFKEAAYFEDPPACKELSIYFSEGKYVQKNLELAEEYKKLSERKVSDW